MKDRERANATQEAQRRMQQFTGAHHNLQNETFFLVLLIGSIRSSDEEGLNVVMEAAQDVVKAARELVAETAGIVDNYRARMRAGEGEDESLGEPEPREDAGDSGPAPEPAERGDEGGGGVILP